MLWLIEDGHFGVPLSYAAASLNENLYPGPRQNEGNSGE